MMDTEHTPGPWQKSRQTNSKTCIYDWHISTADGKHGIARVPDVVPSVSEANANLIAAAPELLEAFDDPEQEHPDAYTLHILDLAVVLLRRCAGEVGLAAALNLECFRARAQAAIAKAKGKE